MLSQTILNYSNYSRKSTIALTILESQQLPQLGDGQREGDSGVARGWAMWAVHPGWRF